MGTNKIIKITIILMISLLLSSCATSGMASTCWGTGKPNKNGVYK